MNTGKIKYITDRSTNYGYRNTKQRRIVWETVRQKREHLTADEIYRIVKEKHPHISRGTVYRNLGILSETGKLLQIKLPMADKYDCRTDFHYHVLCNCCGRLFDAPLEYKCALDQELSALSDFSVIRHRTLFEGVCPDCIKSSDGENKQTGEDE